MEHVETVFFFLILWFEKIKEHGCENLSNIFYCFLQGRSKERSGGGWGYHVYIDAYIGKVMGFACLGLKCQGFAGS